MTAAQLLASARSFRLDLPNGRRLDLEAGRPLVMGVVNVTPDSFSDGGRFLDPDRAVDHALRLAEEGADLLDVGAESSRPGGGVYGPGARRISEPEELARLLPVLERLRPLATVPISVDTEKAVVAREALARGVDLVNDTTALADPAMVEIVARSGCPVVLMHSRGDRSAMQSTIAFRDVVGEVAAELDAEIARAIRAGVRREQTIVDPGIGFGKTTEQNFELIARLERLVALGRPVLVGASRKAFLGAATGAPVAERLPGSLAAAVMAAAHGAAIVRVHDVGATRQALAVAAEIARREPGP